MKSDHSKIDFEKARPALALICVDEAIANGRRFQGKTRADLLAGYAEAISARKKSDDHVKAALFREISGEFVLRGESLPPAEILKEYAELCDALDPWEHILKDPSLSSKYVRYLSEQSH